MNKQASFDTIIYATDLGDHMRPVFRRALAMAECNNAHIIMLHVLEPLTATGMSIVETYLPEQQYQQFHHEGMQKVLETMRRRIAAFCRDETGEHPEESSLVSDVVVAHGKPGDEIPHQAKTRNADLIVVGSCTHGLLGHGILGSTARRVLQSAEVPVLVVPNCNNETGA